VTGLRQHCWPVSACNHTGKFDRDAKEAMQSKTEISHTFNLLDGKTLERKVIPLYRDGVLVGRIAHIKNITNAGRREID